MILSWSKGAGDADPRDTLQHREAVLQVALHVLGTDGFGRSDTREALRRYYLDRREAFWLIPGYAPSAGFLLEILARQPRRQRHARRYDLPGSPDPAGAARAPPGRLRNGVMAMAVNPGSP